MSDDKEFRFNVCIFSVLYKYLFLGKESMKKQRYRGKNRKILVDSIYFEERNESLLCLIL